MEWPQITWIVLNTMAFGVILANHGKPRDPHNAGWALVTLAIEVTLLYFGGFF